MLALDVVDLLIERLEDCRRSAAVKVPIDDEFETGINCRLANEIMWLEDCIEKALTNIEMAYERV